MNMTCDDCGKPVKDCYLEKTALLCRDCHERKIAREMRNMSDRRNTGGKLPSEARK